MKQESSASPPPAPPPGAPPPRRHGLLGRLRGYMIAGILVTTPIGVTLYVADMLLTFIDDSVTPLIPDRYNPNAYLPFAVPGIGLVFLVVALTLIGWLTASLVGRLVVRLGESVVSRMPFVRGVYGATKQIVETVLAQQSEAFNQVVLFEFPRTGCWSLGFVTGKTEGEVQEITEDEVVNVFVPTTPNPTSGYLVFVPRGELVPLSMSVEEGIKMVVSGGIVTPPDRRPPERRQVKLVPAATPHLAAGQPKADVSGS